MDAEKTGGQRDGKPASAPPATTSPEWQTRLLATLEALPDLLFVMDRRGRIVDFHAPNRIGLLLPPERFLGLNAVDVLPEPAATVVRLAIAEALATGHHQGGTYALAMPNGERWFELSIAAHGDRQADDARLVAIARDVTDRRRADVALRESEEKYRLLTEGMKDVVWVLDVEARRFTYVSPSVFQLRGYTAEEILAQPLEAAWTPEERERLAGLLQGYVADFLAGRITEETYVPIEFHQPCQDGSAVPSEAICHLVRNRRTGRLELHGVTRDIAARARVERALRESETRFAEATRQSRAFVWEVDAAGRYMFVSPVVEDVLGYRPDELAGRRHFYDLHPADGRAEFRTAIFEAMDRREKFRDYENPMVAKDGRTRWVSTNAVPLLAKDGALLGYRGVDFDVTARKLAENALRESEAQRRAINDNLPDGFIYQLDSGPDGQRRRYVYVSQGVEKLHGVSAEAVRRDPACIYGQILAEDLPAVAAKEAQAIVAMAPFSAEVRVRLPSGEIRWRLFTSAPRRLSNGHLVWDGIEIDVTERKRAEEALRESEARTRAVQDNLPDGLVYQIDSGPDGQERRFTFLSQGVERLHGVSAENALRDPMAIYGQVLPEDLRAVADCEAQAAKTLTPLRAEVRVRLPSGEIRWRRFTSAPRRLPNGRLVWDGIEIDVTERKQAEAALRQSEAKYRNLHETMRDAFATADLRGRILDFNPAFRKLTGYAAAELRNMPYQRLTPRKWRTAEAKIVKEQVLPRGFSDVYEKEYRRKNGTLVPVELRTILIRDAAGRPTGMWASIRDITERKRAEDALRQSESKYRLLFENMRDAFAAVDLQGRLSDCNPAFEKMLGYSRKELLRLRLADVTPPEWMAVEKKAIAQMRRRGYSKRFEKEYVRKDGTRVPVELQGSLIRDARGRPAGLWAIIRDVTERKRAENELRQAHDDLERRVRERTAELEASRRELAQSEEQFRQMAENVQDAFWLIDARTLQALYASPAFKKIWNWPVEKNVVRWFARIHPEDRDRIARAFRNGLKTGIPGTVTYRLVWPDGSIRWIESTGTMIRDARGRPLRAAGLHRDVTEQRRLEAELLAATETERQRIGRDLHDGLGQSLTAIGYLADAVREDLARAKRPEAADVRKLGRLIGQTAAEAHALARGLLLADVKRGGLAAALQELAFRTQELFGVVCRFTGPGTLPPLDLQTAGQLYRIAQEAATNAAKHGQAQRIEIRLAKERRGLLLSVRDSGRGLPARKINAPGLGLDIMRHRAGLIGATLWIDSQPRRGTTVHCLLPRAAPARKKKR